MRIFYVSTHFQYHYMGKKDGDLTLFDLNKVKRKLVMWNNLPFQFPMSSSLSLFSPDSICTQSHSVTHGMPGRYRVWCFLPPRSNTLAMLGFVHAVSAGFCAALASSCAKLVMSPELQRKFWCDFLLQSVFGGSTLTSLCHTVSRGSCTINNFDIKR